MKIYHYSFTATDEPDKVLHGSGLIGFSSLTPPLEIHAETQKHIQRLGFEEFSITQLHCLGDQLVEDHDPC